MMVFGQELLHPNLCPLPIPLHSILTLLNLVSGDKCKPRILLLIISNYYISPLPRRRKEKPSRSIKIYFVIKESSRPMKIYDKKEDISEDWKMKIIIFKNDFFNGNQRFFNKMQIEMDF